MREQVQKLLTFGLLFIGGNLLAALCIGVVGILYGMAPMELMEALQDATGLPTVLIRASVWIQTIAVFLVPSLVFALVYYRKSVSAYFSINRAPGLLPLVLAVVFLVAGYPFVQASYEVNALIPLGDSAAELEANARKILDQILDMESFAGFLTSLFIIAVLPALGEELAFRGVLQVELAKLFKNGHIGIWVAAVLFSAVHFQFEGFLPRMVLGALMGYLYHWTGNLWIPIFVHFANNGFQVATLYITGTDLSQVDETGGMINYWLLIPAAAILYFTGRYLNSVKAPDGS